MANTFRNYRAQAGAGTTVIVASAGGTNTYGQTRPATSTEVIHALYLSNVDGSVSIPVDLYVDDSTNQLNVLYQVEVPANSTLVLDKPINLETADSLVISVTNANDIEVVASALEIT